MLTFVAILKIIIVSTLVILFPATFRHSKLVKLNTGAHIEECPLDENCLRKCCWEKYSLLNLTEAENDCTPNENGTTQFLVESLQIRKTKSSLEFIEKSPRTLYGLDCLSVTVHKNAYEILKDGTVSYRDVDGISKITDSYCYDINANDNQLSLLVCNNPSRSAVQSNLFFHLICTFFVLSMICLIVTMVVFILISKKKNINEKILIHHVIALFLSSLFLFIKLLRNLYSSTPRKQWILCKQSGFILQYVVLASYFWLNVMSFDMWYTFRRLNLVQSNQVTNNKKKIIQYCIYAWGVPLLIVLITISKEYLFGDNIMEQTCWFNNDGYSGIIYYKIYIFLILVANLYMVIHIMVSSELLHKRQNTASPAITETTSLTSSNCSKRLMLYLQVFTVIGITWILDNAFRSNIILSHISNVLVSLQGVFIFVIYICRKRTYLRLKNRIFSNSTNNVDMTQYSRCKTNTSSNSNS